MKPIPTLKESGFLTTVQEGLLYIFECFVTCENSQSNLFPGQTRSLVYLIKSYPNDPELLANETEAVLLDRYRKYFDEVSVSVSSRSINGDNAGPYKLEIKVGITEGGKTYQLGNVLNDVYGGTNKLINRIARLEGM